MFCQKCGQQVPDDGSTFCTHCGASLAGGSVPTPAGAGPSSAPGLTQSMPPVAPAPQKPKSKAPIVIAVACAAVVLIGGGTVFALTMLNGSKSSDTQISVIDTGSSDEKDSSAKKKGDKSKAKESSSSDDEAVPEDESAYYGSGDSDDYLTDVYTYTNDMHPYSMSIPNRFEMEDTPSGSGARYEDPETGFVINLLATSTLTTKLHTRCSSTWTPRARPTSIPQRATTGTWSRGVRTIRSFTKRRSSRIRRLPRRIWSTRLQTATWGRRLSTRCCRRFRWTRRPCL